MSRLIRQYFVDFSFKAMKEADRAGPAAAAALCKLFPLPAAELSAATGKQLGEAFLQSAQRFPEMGRADSPNKISVKCP